MSPLSSFAFALISSCGALNLPSKYSFTFTPDFDAELSFTPDSATPWILGGKSPKECDTQTPEFSKAEQVSGIAVAVSDDGQGCWTSSAYSHGDFPVRTGLVGNSFKAHELSPHKSSATKFAASGHQVYFLLTAIQDYKIYELRQGGLHEIGKLPASEVRVNGTFTRSSIDADKIKETIVYVVLPATERVPSPTRLSLPGTASECKGIPIAETLDEIAIVTMKSGGSCWTDGRYNYADFLVEKGTIIGTDGSARTSYRIHPPKTPPNKGWAASASNLYFSSKGSEQVTVWTYHDIHDGLAGLGTFTPGESFMQTAIQVHELTEPLTVFLEVSSARVSDWPLLSDSTEGAWLAGNVPSMSFAARRFQVGGRPFAPEDWSFGPGTHSGNYGSIKRYFPVTRADRREGIVWQDMTSGIVQMTWLASDLLSAETTQLVSPSLDKLVAATSDGKSEIVIIMVGKTPIDKKAVTSGTVIKSNSTTGSELRRTALAATDLNIHSCCNPADMSWDTTHSGTIGVMLGRTMTKGGDGLNHQGGIAFVLNSSTLELIFNYGQTSGHSFGASIIPSSLGSFLGMDLGDNYPRGVHLWRLSGSKKSRQNRLVYSFKTRHARSPGLGGATTFGVYDEISSKETTFYKWSNDNYVYTELGHPGLVETSDGILVFFAGEQPPLDSSKVGKSLNSARNIGFVKVPEDLRSADVLSPGAEESGGFYTFGGSWKKQKNVGVSFITSETEMEQSVSRLKTAVLGSGQILLLFEIWSATKYNRSEYLIVDGNGTIQVPQAPVGHNFQLPFADNPILVNGHVVTYAGTAQGHLVRYEMCATGSCPGPATTTTTTTSTTLEDSKNNATERQESSTSIRLTYTTLSLLPVVAAFMHQGVVALVRQ